MQVRPLPSARLRDAHANLASFVRRGRESVAFGNDLDFESDAWDLSKWNGARPSAQGKKVVIYFTTHENGEAKGLDGRRPLLRPFGDLIKAILRIRYEKNPAEPAGLRVLVRASRYLHDGLLQRSDDPCVIRTEDFDLAAASCTLREAESSRYRIGQKLEEIAGWLNKYTISIARIDFKNPFPRITYDDTRIGREHEERRAEKLPSPAAYEALGQISNMVEEPSEVVRMRLIEILVATGFRINEALTLAEDCEVEEEVRANGRPVLDPEGEPRVRYGLGYLPEKGGDPDVKWITSPMVDVVKRAVRDIRFQTASARTTAKWLENHPGRAWFDPENDRGPDQLFTGFDLKINFNFAGRVSGLQWAKGRGLSPAVIENGVLKFRRADIEDALLSQQEAYGGTSSPRLSTYLFVVPQNFCHSKKGTNPSLVGLLTDQQISDFLSGRSSERGATLSLFDRYGFTESDGQPIKLTSHMFRHWLDTLFEQGGLGQHEIARWFGRKDIGQNAAYDHVTGMQKAEQVHRLMESGQMRGGMAEIHRSLSPAIRPHFRDAVVATGHSTDLGLCVNDWSLAPCPDHGSCARCSEHIIVKGDAKQKAAAETLLDEHEWFLADAVREAEEDTYGASNFVAHHWSMVEALRKILAVHNDPEIPDGTLVHLNLRMPSRIENRPLEEV